MSLETQLRQVRLVGGPLDGSVAEIDSSANGNLAAHDKELEREIVYAMRPSDNTVLDFVGYYSLCGNGGS